MKVHEIAKAVGKTSAEVMQDMGLEGGQGAHLQNIDDAQAQEYIASQGAVAPVAAPVSENTPKPKGKARFWSKSRFNNLPSRDDESRSDIVFDEWAYESEQDGPESQLCRKPDS